MSEIVDQITAVHRAVGKRRLATDEARTVLVRRTYDETIGNVWGACTDPERISQWFLPVSGDLHLGGTYQLEGNAGGEILRCEPPRLFGVSWVYGALPEEADFSEVEVRLAATADRRTVFELEHAAVVDPTMWGRFGPGGVGVGWDLGLLGLFRHLRGESEGVLRAWQESEEAALFMTKSSEEWGAAYEASGAAPAEASAGAAATTRAYVQEAAPE
jgi:uncharacterized protein YndB with AHSA1/START domain